ncbi:1-acyl-sn-glycerol-3-phosphate acyltransferase alpha-like isoform X1 [Macrosteles quadrilineatus]|uniref:1-acyl-sn-glycerol-3-phosphate acyltransferase alpha-like isoform X1 n=2 Tax=Macrosteles quadrilineatus TaxID=74068 RepID=UPI0023E1CEE5|nr:1-acyl-sn-glycerol-3-phosphate acyltransferase alpha-like isoform X1 [Macrosteles quadrilineatus]
MLSLTLDTMISLFNILQLELHMFPAAVILILLLPLSSNLKIRYYGCFMVYILSISCLSVVLMPVFIFRPKLVHNCVITSYFMRHISKLLKIKWELRGGDILEVERGAVIVANHQTMLDVLGMFDFWDVMGKCAAVARKEVFYIWPFGLAAWLAGVVFIDRKKAKKANLQLDEASRLITKEKTKLWMFPEGTRNHKGDTLLPFKRGAFRVAVSCQAPIIPVVFSPYYFLNSEKKHFGQGRVIIQVLEPISTKGLSEDDMDKVMEKSREMMIKQYELLKQEVLTHNTPKNE